jgi:glutamyl-tRNA synthetase
MTPAEFVTVARPFLPPEWLLDPVAEAGFDALAAAVQTRVTTLSQVRGLVDFLFLPGAPADPASWQRVMTGQAAAILSDAREAFSVVPWEPDAIAEAVHAIADRREMKVRDAQAPVRVAVMGRSQGLPLWDSLAVLGRPRTLERIEAAMARLA